MSTILFMGFSPIEINADFNHSGEGLISTSLIILPKYKAVYSEDEKRKIIDKLIMPTFRKYSFLQGEEIDEMIDFSNKSSIEEAVQNLTDIKKYEDLVEKIPETELSSRNIPRDVKDSVWNRDGGRCVGCGSNKNLEFDHIIPHSKGGSNTYRNIQLLCESCNRTKSDKIG